MNYTFMSNPDSHREKRNRELSSSSSISSNPRDNKKYRHYSSSSSSIDDTFSPIQTMSHTGTFMNQNGGGVPVPQYGSPHLHHQNLMNPSPPQMYPPGYMGGGGGPSLSEEDINRVVLALKTSLRSEIKELVENEVSKRVHPLIERLEILESENRELRLHIDDVEQYGRRSLVRFAGIPEDQEEDTTAKVMEAMSAAGVDLRPTDVERSHRVGKPKQQTDRDPAKPRPIIMRLKSVDAKFRLLKSSKAFRDSDMFSSVSVNEDLTRYRNELFYHARQLSKKNKIQQTWTTNGKVMVKVGKDNNSRVFQIRTESDLVAYGHVLSGQR